MGLALRQDHGLVKWASEVGPAGWDGVTSTRPVPMEIGRSEAITVKWEPRQQAFEQAGNRMMSGCSSLKTWNARVGWKHLWPVGPESRKARGCLAGLARSEPRQR